MRPVSAKKKKQSEKNVFGRFCDEQHEDLLLSSDLFKTVKEVKLQLQASVRGRGGRFKIQLHKFKESIRVMWDCFSFSENK